MKKLFMSVLILCLVLSAQEFHVDKAKENIVKFISDAPLEDFEGITNYIDGYMYLKSLDDLTDNQLYFEVDLTMLDTGIELRNRHMRDNYLETDKYRFTFFEGKFRQLIKSTDEYYTAEVIGKLFIHGVTNSIEITGTIKKLNEGFVIESNFTIALSDYNIDIPQIMFMKIDEVMKLHLKFHLEIFTHNGE